MKILVSAKLLESHKRAYRHKNMDSVSLHVINPLPKSFAANAKQDLQPATLISTAPQKLDLNDNILTHNVSSRQSSTSSRPSSNCDQMKKSRQLSFVNIQRKLREREIILRHQYPDIYAKLCSYVENDEQFAPAVIYPKDSKTGKNFMCLILPGSEPQMLGWVKSPGLLNDIDVG